MRGGEGEGGGGGDGEGKGKGKRKGGNKTEREIEVILGGATFFLELGVASCTSVAQEEVGEVAEGIVEEGWR